MNLRRLQGMMIGVAALVTLGSTAIAAPPDVTHRQVQVKNALTVFDLGLTGLYPIELRMREELRLVDARCSESAA